MHLLKYRGLLVIVLWQAAPVGVDQYGRTRLGFGVGRGTLEFANFDCEGTLIEAQTVHFTTAAAEVEHWIAPGKWRLHGAVGYQWSDSLSIRGPIGAALVSYDARKFGIGGGLAFVPDESIQVVTDPNTPPTPTTNVEPYPSLYLRIGNRDRLHFRTELFAPSVQTPMLRLVIGYNQFASQRPSGAIGFGKIGVEGDTEALVVDYFHPVSPTTAIGVSAYASPGHDKAQAGLTARARFTIQ